MTAEIIDRGRGPEIKGTRITVLNIIPYLEGGFSHEEIQDVLSLTPEQLAAALTYLDEHREELMAHHRRIEERNARGNPPEIEAKLEQTHRRLMRFQEWRSQHRQNGAANGNFVQEFKDWLKREETGEDQRP